MENYELIMDKFSGMISKEVAIKIMKGEIPIDIDNNLSTKQKKRINNINSTSDITDVRNTIEFINTKRNIMIGDNKEEGNYIIDIKDVVYRIFNPQESKLKKGIKRTLVLGYEGATINFVVHNKLSDFIDVNIIERGDTIFIRKALLDIKQNLLYDQKSTLISKIAPTTNKIYVVSELSAGMRGIDVIGRITEIGAIKYVSGLGNEQVAVASAKLSLNDKSVDVSLWGSSALATTKMNLNDFVKIEFCNVRNKFDKLEIIANDYSRVFASNLLAQRVRRAELS
ncbi:MAG: hypothetical protein ACP5UN_01475 [Candidatus Micrarchaeia archaeon]